MTSRHREIETKLEAPAEARVPTLAGTGTIVVADEPVEHDLEATYFDTEARALAAAGISLRRRTGGDDAGWHLKVPIGEGVRDELREPLGRATKTVPEPLRSAVHLWSRGEPLVPVARLQTHRAVHRLRDADGRVLVEIADDAVVARSPVDSTTTTAWCEWEVEAVEGGRDDVDAVVQQLLAVGATPAASASKLARALAGGTAPPAPEPEPALDAQSSAEDVLAAALAEQVDELRRRDPLVRLAADGAVHRMRVASRRLRSLLATFRPLLDRARTDPLRDELRWFAGVLGAARDAEVQCARLAALVAEQPVELVMGAVGQRIDDALRARHRQALGAAHAAMRSERYLALMDDLQRLATAPPWAGASGGSPQDGTGGSPQGGSGGSPQDALRSRVRREHRRTRRRVEAATAAPAAERDALLHEARKAAKRARYAAEALVPVAGREARRAAKAAKRVQQALGEQHDTVVARSLLRELGVQAHLDGDSAFTFGLLHAREHERAAASEAAFERAWARLRRKRVRRWLQ
ncbi:CYTH and CHAD domain-containing protein [Agrococcus beijingensis]|uniref:CYTH and CHAD domain-containing protein n=1 Tax=Agrococcus beijingensis TaxID=3068634 RepID=UPI0027403FC3|nr:CYTH and CHAD domain-containing protein [Agrococcus sp. REN33]